MTKYVELIDKYEIRQSDSDEYNPPSYIWGDNTGELIRCKDCRKHNDEVECPLVRYRGFAQQHEFDYQYCVYAEKLISHDDQIKRKEEGQKKYIELMYQLFELIYQLFDRKEE